MNAIVHKHLRLLLMLKVHWWLFLIPVYLLFFYYSELLRGIVYIFATVVMFGPIVSTLEDIDVRNKTHAVFYSLPVRRRDIELWGTVTAYGLLGLILALVFLASVLMHVWLEWPIMTLGEVLFIVFILNAEGLLEATCSGFYSDVYTHKLKFFFVIILFFVLSFLVYPYIIASLYRLDVSWPTGSNPIRVTVDMLNRPLPAVVMSVIVCLIFSLSLKRSIRNTETREV